jgi:hypothetical protein
LINLFAAAALLGQEAPQSPPPAPASPAALPQLDRQGPRIQFGATNYDFGKIKAGELVKHVYTFTNTGDEPLEINAVRPGCGCTTATEWTHKVEPGQGGTIALQFDSTKFSGPVHKLVTVTSNDKQQPNVNLQLSGTVWKEYEIIPPYPVLTVGPEATNASVNVRVISNLEEPVAISACTSSNPDFGAVIVRTNVPGKEYLLRIIALPHTNSGSVQAKVVLNMSSTNVPVIEVPFWANLLPVITLSPPEILLPASPLPNKATPTLLLQNNTSKPFALSETALNVPGIEFKVTEPYPGRMFNVAFTFPEGFELPTEREVFFSATTGNPLLPSIRVPIRQAPVASLPRSNSIAGSLPDASQLPPEARRALKFQR